MVVDVGAIRQLGSTRVIGKLESPIVATRMTVRISSPTIKITRNGLIPSVTRLRRRISGSDALSSREKRCGISATTSHHRGVAGLYEPGIVLVAQTVRCPRTLVLRDFIRRRCIVSLI